MDARHKQSLTEAISLSRGTDSCVPLHRAHDNPCLTKTATSWFSNQGGCPFVFICPFDRHKLATSNEIMSRIKIIYPSAKCTIPSAQMVLGPMLAAVGACPAATNVGPMTFCPLECAWNCTGDLWACLWTYGNGVHIPFIYIHYYSVGGKGRTQNIDVLVVILNLTALDLRFQMIDKHTISRHDPNMNNIH